MKCNAEKFWRGRWAWCMLAEAIIMGVAALLIAPIVLYLPSGSAGWVYHVYLWIAYPALGAFVAARAVGLGVNPYAAWPFACVMMPMVHYWILGYPPASFGMVLVAAVAAIAGSAAGDVRNQRKRRGRRSG